MNDTKTTTPNTTGLPVPNVTAEALAHLGEGHIAYVRAIRSEELNRLFPQAPKLDPGLDLFAQAHPDFTLLPAQDVLAHAQVETAQAAELSEDGFLRLWPHRHRSDGFFAAVWERNK